MQWLKILTPFLLGASLAGALPSVSAQTRGDDVLLEMQKAFRQKDKQKLTALLPGARGHVLEPWAAYWELKARLEEATQDEVDAFLQRYAGSYQEDRLRNDWLLLLGQRRDWERFLDMHAKFRMRDDKEVQCYALNVDQMLGKATEDIAAVVLANWYAQRDVDDGCAYAAAELFAAKKIKPLDVWRKARLAAEANRLRAVQKAVQIVAPESVGGLREAVDSPTKYLTGRATARGKMKQEFIVLALIRMAMSDPSAAARLLDSKWGVQLSAEERNWLWGLIGKQSAIALSGDALGYFANVSRDADLTDDMLGWRARAALRAGQWKVVARSIDAMTVAGRNDPTWVYWRGRAYMSNRPGDEDRANAKRLFESIAGSSSFYEQLAREELGQKITAPAAPAPLTPEEMAAAKANPALNRGVYAILLGLRSEGVREWNYATNLHAPGGMGDRELLAAADFACKQEVWDRCINTSERTKSFIDVTQRFPMPFRSSVVDHSQRIGLDPAYVYGLIRQESRFIMDARSHVGASGLMQVMPATAKWTARKIGMTDFTPDMIYDRETNITIGTAYLKLALDDFDDSMALAAAGYNAGPGRPRNWRNGPVIEGAIWAENVPFAETRGYVKNVLANTTNYAAILTGQPQSVKARLGTIGPRLASEPEPNKDLP
ncbi:lytic transglycosylase domain-containing protein [Diaphorobacter ruginosibacter]|uniref:Lytic transglycosylase domain-containing protein n=1 Tax=Diaphorobacter ruginosibacter TaxID=1715720 RepID=A0A7G9RQC4_9BURK|nr:lytic transglycosylase domain-containing protein [Diaphorobacter ruginosibacter]QNN57799.1 lytic transglycosylase domain-containing protein [Diaphorobacter ruginosibacter]